MPAKTDASSQPQSQWYQQSIVWLGMAVFLASIAGCVWLIVVSVRYADTPLTDARGVLGVPATTHSAPHPASSSANP